MTVPPAPAAHGSATPPRSIAELMEVVARGTPVEYLFFWGHKPQPDGSIGLGALSQWWPVTFVAEGHTFTSAEHYMMWSKATMFGDMAAARRVLTATHAHAAKAIGREVTGFDPATWNRRRFDVVVAGSLAKFGQHRDLRAYLLGTGDRVLVEASPTDRIWGIGLAADDARAADLYQWKGLNLLGFALMQARLRLRDESE